MNQTYDVIIVGTGVAGLYCALNLPESFRVCILTKQNAEDANSFLAQGGICVLRGEDDYADYYEDTMRAGHYENNPETVELVLRSSNAVIRDLIRRGVRFNRTPDGQLAYTREGAHSRPRILYHQDITGHEISSTLLQRVREKQNVTLFEHTTMLDVLVQDERCCGVVAQQDGQPVRCVYARAVVLACGGIGGLYQSSTSFPHITGDALAIALKHGITIEHLNYVQMHPTALYSTKKGRKFLISESVRGEGAVLLDKSGQRFTDELQPRDVVSQAIWQQMEKDGTDHVWEDLRPLGKTLIMEHFPNIYDACRAEGYDVLSQPIPVAPAEHYLMGGIAVDMASRTSMPGLYACGETSCNGIHGKNRLASNSLLESLVFAARAADDIVFGCHPAPAPTTVPVNLDAYENHAALFQDYGRAVLTEIERLNHHE